MSDLIDTTEMYLRTVYELQEEGIVPLRARIAERLHQSGPTVSQTVARMERDGLLTVEGDRHLELTPEGHSLATRVMRKHRLAERLLTDVIGLEWELVHDEACRWEHVMSESVERRLLELLEHPTESPYGNPIPGLTELGEAADGEQFMDGVEPLSAFAAAEPVRVKVSRIAERLHQSGPTVSQTVARMERDGLLTVEGDRHLELTPEGHSLATRVMRKHRLAERLLTDVIGLEWELVHDEACRWEHVMSESVERRLLELLEHPTESPYGNPIPGLTELGEAADGEQFMDGVEPLSAFAAAEPVRVKVSRIAEELQKDEVLMRALRRIGALPGSVVNASGAEEGVLVGSGGETAEILADAADHIFVKRA